MSTSSGVVVLPSVEDVGLALQRFHWLDYLMFITMLGLCLGVGLYFGFYRVAVSAQDYLMGGRKMTILPISMSLIASFISGISILGIPTETYLYGVQYLYLVCGLFVMTGIMAHLYLPVFYGLNLTSTYEYLERRFDKKVRLFGSLLFTVNMFTWLPVVIYVPALAFNHVTGVNVHLITPLLCTICIFYTSLGGLKAVVWTDVIQAFIMIGAMLLLAVKGTMDIGGFHTLWERNLKSGRIETPKFGLELSSRYNFWTLVIGGSVYCLQTAAVNQNMIQRYLSLGSLRSAKKAVYCCSFGIMVIILVSGYCGLLTYATFYECDPLATKLAKEKDQLLPLLVMQVLGDYPGLAGIFVAGILSASLSSLSTGLNAMAAVTIEDFHHSFFTRPLTERQSSILMRTTVIVFGGVCVGLVYVIEHLGAVLQMTMSIGGMASGPSLGMFTMGMFLPWVNAIGALIGGTTSFIFMAWLCLRAQAAIAAGELVFPEKPLTTDGCFYHFVPKTLSFAPFNSSVDGSLDDGVFIFHHISYLWYTLLGALISMVVGLVVSFVTTPTDPRDIDPKLLAHCVRKCIQAREFPNEPNADGIILAYGIQKVSMEPKDF